MTDALRNALDCDKMHLQGADKCIWGLWQIGMMVYLGLLKSDADFVSLHDSIVVILLLCFLQAWQRKTEMRFL